MTDQMIPADKVREIIARYRDSTGRRGGMILDALGDLLLPPPRPTLADMTLDEQDECTGMQADLAQGDRVVILDGTPDHDGLVQVLEKSLDVYRSYPAEVTPRPDLPRLEWPGDTEADLAPTPALPDGWRLADHNKHGRVIVTSASTSPNSDGYVYILLPTAESKGYDWVFCPTNRLMFLDTGQEADQ